MGNEEFSSRVSPSQNTYANTLLKEMEKSFSMERLYETARRKRTLELIEEINAKSILDVGCGPHPILSYCSEISSYTAVEPQYIFYRNAIKISRRTHIETKILLGKFEDHYKLLRDKNFDLIILNSLLHEVASPSKFLKLVRQVCDENTLVVATVPNSQSFHRLLAYEIGLISSIYDTSAKDSLFKRVTHFDVNSLSSLFVKNHFEVITTYTYFMKLFSDSQIEEMYNRKMISKEVVFGLDKISKYVGNFGAEIFITAKQSDV